MAAPNFMYPQTGNMFGTNPLQQTMMQYQANTMGQTSVTTFINVPSEQVARQWDLPPNTTGNFININDGYIYLKTTGSSILEPYKFVRIRLEEEPDEQTPVAQEQAKSQVNLDNYITKEELQAKLEPYENTIKEMQEVVKELKG